MLIFSSTTVRLLDNHKKKQKRLVHRTVVEMEGNVEDLHASLSEITTKSRTFLDPQDTAAAEKSETSVSLNRPPSELQSEEENEQTDPSKQINSELLPQASASPAEESECSSKKVVEGECFSPAQSSNDKRTSHPSEDPQPNSSKSHAASVQDSTTSAKKSRKLKRKVPPSLDEDHALFVAHRSFRDQPPQGTIQSPLHVPYSSVSTILPALVEWKDDASLVYAQLLWKYARKEICALVQPPSLKELKM